VVAVSRQQADQDAEQQPPRRSAAAPQRPAPRPDRLRALAYAPEPAAPQTTAQPPPAAAPPTVAPPPSPPPQTASAPAASEQRSQPRAGGASAAGAELNQQGFELMKRGDYSQAVPLLRRAVDAYPARTRELDHAYALYNLGRSLRLSGRQKQAVPVLKRRLAIPNQTAVVRRELNAARRPKQTATKPPLK
jgi:tetratricopeptide (TPR) repeat protein